MTNSNENTEESRVTTLLKKLWHWFRYTFIGYTIYEGWLYPLFHLAWFVVLVFIMIKDLNFNPVFVLFFWIIWYFFNGLWLYHRFWKHFGPTKKFFDEYYYCYNNTRSDAGARSFVSWLGASGGILLAMTVGAFIAGNWFAAGDGTYIAHHTPATNAVQIHQAREAFLHVPFRQSVYMWHLNFTVEGIESVARLSDGNYIEFDFVVDVSLRDPEDSLINLTPEYHDEETYISYVKDQIPLAIADKLSTAELANMQNYLSFELDLGNSLPIDNALVYWSGVVEISNVHAHAPVDEVK